MGVKRESEVIPGLNREGLETTRLRCRSEKIMLQTEGPVQIYRPDRETMSSVLRTTSDCGYERQSWEAEEAGGRVGARKGSSGSWSLNLTLQATGSH